MTLILASQSASRRAMLDAAGVPFSAQPADVDEAAIRDAMLDEGADPPRIAAALAQAKALAITATREVVLGSDSMVSVDGRLFEKPESRDDAARHLAYFSGRVIDLYSAAAIVQDGAVVWHHTDHAVLAVRNLSHAFIEDYLDAEWPAISGCVGCFRMEARGVQLFEHISGSHFTILGMPLMPVLTQLRKLQLIPS